MKDYEKEIGGYIDNYNQKLELIEDKKEVEKYSLEELKEEFIVLAEQTIKPTFEKLKIFLEKKNQGCSIELKTHFHFDDELPCIDIEIHPPFKRNFGFDSYLRIKFHLTKSEKIGVYVEKHMPNGEGSAGSEGEFDIDEITSEFVEQKIINLIKNCYYGS